MRAKRICRAHPVCKNVPPMSAEDFDVLKQDIAARGLVEEIWTFEGMILDGFNRYQACKQLGIAPRYRAYEGSDPEGFVWSCNIARRHLKPNQLRAYLKRLLKADPSRTDVAVAKIAGCSDKTVAKVRESCSEIPSTTTRVRSDGRRVKMPKSPSPPVVHRASVLVSRTDFECRKMLRFVADLRADQITDPQDFVTQLEAQLARLKYDLVIARSITHEKEA